MSFSKSYNELAGTGLPELPEKVTSVIRRLYDARQKPLAELTPAEVRLLINRSDAQKLPLIPELMSVALDLLTENILIEADYYPGDLLYTVLKQSSTFWQGHTELHQRLTKLITAEREKLDRLLEGSMKRDLPELADAFLSAQYN